jgi:hypothetical protein
LVLKTQAWVRTHYVHLRFCSSEAVSYFPPTSTTKEPVRHELANCLPVPIGDAFIFFEKKGEEKKGEGRKKKKKEKRERSEIDSTTNHDAKSQHCLSWSKAMTEIPTEAGVKTEDVASETRVLTARSTVLKL